MVKKLDVIKNNFSCFVRVPMVCACDDSALYQTVLTGMLLYDAMHYACFGTSSYIENERRLAWTKKDTKELMWQGAKMYSEASGERDGLALFVTLNPGRSAFSWTYIPRNTYLPIIVNVLPMVIAYPFYELHLTKDICPILRRDHFESLSFTDAIKYDRTRTTALKRMEGYLYVKPDYSSFSSFRLAPIGSRLDAETKSKIWMTKKALHGPEELDSEDEDNKKILPCYPVSISDVKDIAFAAYSNDSVIVQSDPLHKTIVSDLYNEYVVKLSDLFSSYFLSKEERHIAKSRIIKYFNIFLYHKPKQEIGESIIDHEMSVSLKDNIINNNKKEMKDGMFGNMMEKFKQMIVPVTDPNLKITMDGNVAVRNSDGEYVSINADNEIVNYPADFTLTVPIYVIKKPFVSIQIGEILKKGNSYVKVIGKNTDGSLKCLSFTGSITSKKPVTDFMLGASYADVVVNIMNIQNAGINPMMLALMNNENGEMSSKEMMMFMMMSGGMNGGMGQMNPMMLMMLMGDKNGNGGSMSKMLEVMMMSQMFSGQQSQMGGFNMGFGNMFGGGQQMANPFTAMFRGMTGQAPQPKAHPKSPESETPETETAE